MTSKQALLNIESFLAYEDFQEELRAIAEDLNALRIMTEDTDLMTYIKDYYENMWSDIHDENDMEFMKQWSIKAYEQSYRQKWGG